jgi:hypothetical protein
MSARTAGASPIRLPATMRFLERDWLSSNGILFDDGRTATLVDTGFDRGHRLLCATPGGHGHDGDEHQRHHRQPQPLHLLLVLQHPPNPLRQLLQRRPPLLVRHDV